MAARFVVLAASTVGPHPRGVVCRILGPCVSGIYARISSFPFDLNFCGHLNIQFSVIGHHRCYAGTAGLENGLGKFFVPSVPTFKSWQWAGEHVA